MSATEAIRKAIEVLNIQDVYLRECKVSMRKDFDPKYWSSPIMANYAWGPRQGEMAEIGDSEKDEKHNLWKVNFYTRCRLLPGIESPPSDYEPKAEDVLASIELLFIAEYRLLDTSVEHRALVEFSQHNVAYHIWPYWREHLHDVTSRTHLPRITLPMHVFKPISTERAEAESGKQQ